MSASPDRRRPLTVALTVAAGLGAGYTIQPYRNTRDAEFREPALRHTRWAVGRWIAYGDQDPRISIQNLRALSGYLFPDVKARGLKWQVSLEADPIGNASIKACVNVLDFVAFDAWGFDGSGSIVPDVPSTASALRRKK